MILQGESYFWGLCATIYIVTCLMFSAIRWFHACNKPKEARAYVWPDRKMQARIYLLSLCLLPYIFNPTDANAWLLWKSYFPATYYFYCGVLLFCFFGTVKQWDQWKGVSWLAGAVVALTMLPLIINAWIPGCILHPDKWGGRFYLYIVIATSLLMMCYCGMSMIQVWKWMKQSCDDNYSNPEDFPLNYARRVWLAPIYFTPFLWIGFVTDSPTIMMGANIILSVMNVLLLIIVMQSWRRAVMLPAATEEQEEEAGVETSESLHEEIAADRIQKIAHFIDEYINQQQAFLNPHLKIENVVNGCGYSRTYVSKAFQECYGGFFNYVNGLRLSYYDRYAAAHPAMTKEAVALASGFTSYQSYYKVRERMKTINHKKD